MADPIYGDNNDNIISGGYLDDMIFALGGNDTVNGSWGDDFISAGIGNDTVNGGQNNDFINGEAGDDILDGDTGDDYLNGGAGKDRINGGAGDDMVIISSMAELVGVLNGKAWGDLIDGGSGVDTLNLTFTNSTAAITFTGKDPILANAFGAASIKGFEQYNITGGSGADRLTGYSLSDVLSGGKGADTLVGLFGSDVLQGGEGGDRVAGGAGSDYVSGDAGNDNLTGDNGFDTVQGGAGADLINGGTGDDFLASGVLSFDGRGDLAAEIDTLLGGNGNDRIQMGIKDVADGGAHFDTIQLDFTASAVAENFIFSAAMNFASGGSAKNFEALQFFGGRGADNVTGGANADVLNGGLGNDLLRGALGSDTLVDSVGRDRMYGDAGDDTFQLSASNAFGDIYDGGIDKDTVIFWNDGDDGGDSSMSGFLDLETQSLNDGLLKGDIFLNIETFIGSDRDDFIFGNRLANTFIGGEGDDVLDGRAGNDLLVGGDGSDTMTGGLGKDVFDLSAEGYHAGWLGDMVTDFTRGEDKLQISLDSLGLDEAPVFTILVGNNPAATGKGPQLLFDTATDRLWIDLDGAGGEHTSLLIATLDNVNTLAVTDFQFI